MYQRLLSTNTILYCTEWEKTVRFYRDQLKLPLNFCTDWFFEFRLTGASRLSLVDEKRATVKGAGGKGVTLSLEVDDVVAVRAFAVEAGLKPGSIRKHPWGARIFFLYDPEGHRIEVWQDDAR